MTPPNPNYQQRVRSLTERAPRRETADRTCPPPCGGIIQVHDDGSEHHFGRCSQ